MPITNLSTEFIVSSKQVYVLDDTVIVCLKNSYVWWPLPCFSYLIWLTCVKRCRCVYRRGENVERRPDILLSGHPDKREESSAINCTRSDWRIHKICSPYTLVFIFWHHWTESYHSLIADSLALCESYLNLITFGQTVAKHVRDYGCQLANTVKRWVIPEKFQFVLGSFLSAPWICL